MYLNNLPIYNLVIDESAEEDGVSMMSIVDKPAVEKDFLKFSTHQKVCFGKQAIKYSLNEEKRIITGVALRADYPIYRKDDEKEYYINMDAAVIEKIVRKFMREKRNSEVNLQHAFDTKGVYLFESFILNENHTLSYPEFKDVSKGSWIVSYKVENEKVWEKIKKGELKGFSVELTGELKESESLQSEQYRELYNILKTM